jgi:E1A/CREB-binding protein
MDDEIKKNMTVIHNFFCGLHLMVGMADTVCASLVKFEELSCEDPLAQSPSSFGTAVRAVRETCKALSRGGDEKSGCFRQWRVFCERHSNSEDIQLVQNFKGNRFNIVFLLGGNVYYLHKKIIQLLQEMKEPNCLLKSVLDNLLNPFVLAGCKALGLLRKLVMNPLWRLTENKDTHVLDMNQNYVKLCGFLGQCGDNSDTLLEFLAGRISPFQESLVEKDKVFDYLCEGSKYDELCAEIWKPTMMSLKLYVERAVVDQLPGGRYWESSEELTNETNATPKHNKAPERIFGMLDFLVHRRPNASVLTNEAYLLFSHNHTSAWVDTLSSDELDQLMASVRKGTKDLKQKFKDREKEIMRLHTEKQVQDAEKIAQLRKKRLVRKTELTESVIDAGLWQTKEQVIEKLGGCDSDAEKRRALTKQIRFRHEVLCQHHEDKSVFVFSVSDTDKRRRQKSSDVLYSNLIALINSASSVATSQSISKNDKEKEYIPLLVGKHVNHKFGDGETYSGKVISQVPGFPAWYNITYEGDDAVYSFRLVDDYRTGDLEILP